MKSLSCKEEGVGQLPAPLTLPLTSASLLAAGLDHVAKPMVPRTGHALMRHDAGTHEALISQGSGFSLETTAVLVHNSGWTNQVLCRLQKPGNTCQNTLNIAC